MRVNIMVGGPDSLIPLSVVHARQNEKWVGVDIGATRLLNEGITPAVAVGDFDSTNAQQFNRVKGAIDDIHLFPPVKDYTVQAGSDYDFWCNWRAARSIFEQSLFAIRKRIQGLLRKNPTYR